MRTHVRTTARNASGCDQAASRAGLTSRSRTRWPMPARVAATIALAGLAVSILGGCEVSTTAKPGDVAGTFIITVGDADMAASALVDSNLGPRDPAATDTLTVVSLPIVEPVTPHAQVSASNSFLSPPTCLSVTADGRYAFVVEYRGPAPEGATALDQLPIGNTVTAVDLTDPMKPVVIAKAEVSKEPIALSVHPNGDLVAVVAQQPRQQIVILQFKDGQFTGEPAAWPLLGLDADDAKPSSIAWHPSGNALAVTLQDRGEVVFYRFKRGTSPQDEGSLALAPWGPPIKVGSSPLSGVFTADGTHFIVNDVMWSADDGFSVGAPVGQLVSIRLGALPEADTASVDGAQESAATGHSIVSTATVGISPIGLALSKDGTLVATANLRRSHLPDGDPRIDPEARGGSLSLATLSRDGQLSAAGEFPLNALPAGVSFDAKDNFLLVTQFRSFDAAAVDGELSFWKVVRGGESPSLHLQDFFVGVGKGPHGVLIVR